MFKFKKQSGFTLVELLIVIAIIGILTSIVYYSFSDSRAQARDRVRQTNLKELELAVELYRAQNGRYPAAGCGAGVNNWGMQNSCAEYIVGLTPDFIGSLPRENVSGTNFGYLYRTNANGTAFKIVSNRVVENLRITSFEEPFAMCPRATTVGSGRCSTPNPNDFGVTYAVYRGTGADIWLAP